CAATNPNKTGTTTTKQKENVKCYADSGHLSSQREVGVGSEWADSLLQRESRTARDVSLQIPPPQQTGVYSRGGPLLRVEGCSHSRTATVVSQDTSSKAHTMTVSVLRLYSWCLAS